MSFEPDPELVASFTSLGNSQRNVSNYITAVLAIGNANALSGPLVRYNDARIAVNNAQEHGRQYALTVGQPLAHIVSDTVAFGLTTFPQHVAALRGLLAGIPAGSDPTSAQAAELATHVDVLNAALSALSTALAALKAPLHQAISDVRADHVALSDGAASLANILPTAAAELEETIRKLNKMPGGGGILIAVFRKHFQLLVDAAAAIKQLGGETETVQNTFEQVLSGFSTLTGKYASISRDLGNGHNPVTSAGLDKAEAAWRDLAAFLARTFAPPAHYALVAVQPSSISFACDVEESLDALADLLNAGVSINAGAIGIENIDLEPATNPPEPWFSAFDQKLKNAQARSNVWLEELGPRLSSDVPQTFIDAGITFASALHELAALTANSGLSDGERSARALKILADCQAGLADACNTIAEIADGMQADAAGVAADEQQLMAGADSAQAHLAMDQATAAALRTQVHAVRDDIESCNERIQRSYLQERLSIALKPVASAVGSALDIKGLGNVLVVSVRGALHQREIATAQLYEDIAKLRVLQASLKLEERQISALTDVVGAQTSLNNSVGLGVSAVNRAAGVFVPANAAVTQAILALHNGAPLHAVLQSVDVETTNASWAVVGECANAAQAMAAGAELTDVIVV